MFGKRKWRPLRSWASHDGPGISSRTLLSWSAFRNTLQLDSSDLSVKTKQFSSFSIQLVQLEIEKAFVNSGKIYFLLSPSKFIRKWVEQDLPRRIGKPVEFHQCHRKVNFQHDIDDVMCQTWIWYWVYFRVIHEVINCKIVHITTQRGSSLSLISVNYLLDVTKNYCNSCTHHDRRKPKSQTCSSFQLLAFWFVQYRLPK